MLARVLYRRPRIDAAPSALGRAMAIANRADFGVVKHNTEVILPAARA
jgi:hypothetical protein